MKMIVRMREISELMMLFHQYIKSELILLLKRKSNLFYIIDIRINVFN